MKAFKLQRAHYPSLCMSEAKQTSVETEVSPKLVHISCFVFLCHSRVRERRVKKPYGLNC